MGHTGATDVLIAGAGPVGLSAAAELRRHGVSCRLVDRLPARLPYAKAVGIQPRTLEIWDRMGLARSVLEAASVLRGQLIYVNGREQARIDLRLPPEVPYEFAALPQYETERLLEEYVAGLGTFIERGTELLSFTQDDDGVTARLRTSSGAEEEFRTGYLIGCDGAHSTVRKGLGLSFEGAAFAEEYMLGDVEADWDLPHGYGLRSLHRTPDGTTDDLLVCIPLPGAGRYRMSMLVPPELSTEPGKEADGDGGDVAHGLTGHGLTGQELAAHGLTGQELAAHGLTGQELAAHGLTGHGLEGCGMEGDGGARTPELHHLQTVVDRLAPKPASLSRLRWSSVFRISHRIVDRYADGRVFVAGDAAHIHPPTGAQGMNTGIQDACNLAWKLALVLKGKAGPALLTTYDAERRPVGEEVVGRTVRHATQGIEAGPDDARTLLLREAQLLIDYRNGPLATASHGPPDAPRPGDRAPDCPGLTTPAAAYPWRLLDILRNRPDHVLLLYATDPTEAAKAATPDIQTIVVLARGSTPTLSAPDTLPVPVYRDTAAEFARLYRPDGPTGYIVRPDGYLAARFPLTATTTAVSDYLTAWEGRGGGEAAT